MSDENTLMVIEGEAYQGTEIDRARVIEFGDTLMGVHPGAKEIGVIGMRNIAQLALVTGANPLPGTNGIHAWKDSKGLHIQFGIDYWRSQADAEGGILWIDHPRPMTDDERDYYGILDGQMASICRGCLMREAVALMREMKSLGESMTLEEAKANVSRIGTGVASASEYAKAGRSRQWSSDIRAERDLLRQLVPTMRKALARAQSGEFVGGGEGWSAGEFTRSHDPALKPPADYSAEEATSDLIDYDDPGTRAIEVTEDGEIMEAEYEEQVEPEAQEKEVQKEDEKATVDESAEQVEVANLSHAEIIKMATEPKQESAAEDGMMPKDEMDIYESDSHADFLAVIMKNMPRLDHPKHIHHVIVDIGHRGGLNDVPYITGRDKVEENIKAKRVKRLQVYREIKAREAQKAQEGE